MTDSTLSANHASRLGGAVICSSGTMTVINSTFSNNADPGGQVGGGKGGAIYNSGCTVTLTNTTLSGNSALSQGGGIVNNSGTLALSSSTLSGTSFSPPRATS